MNTELMVEDRVVMNVLGKYAMRSNVGIAKYGTTLYDNNKDNFVNHLQEELMDATLYLEKIMFLNKEITRLVKDHPNDCELGMLIRKMVI